MADALSMRIGCAPAECSKRDEGIPLCRFSCGYRSMESLSFQKCVSRRPPLPSLKTSSRSGRPSVQVHAVVGYPPSMVWWTKGNQPNMRDINSAQEFVEAIANTGDKLVLVDFYAVGCRSCKALHPKICQIAADNPDIEVLKVNFYDNNALCKSLNVSMLPFFHFYRGKEGRIDAFSCSLTKIDKLRTAVAKHKGERAAVPAVKRKGERVALPAPGPVVPVANRKDLLPMSTPAFATAGAAL